MPSLDDVNEAMHKAVEATEDAWALFQQYRNEQKPPPEPPPDPRPVPRITAVWTGTTHNTVSVSWKVEHPERLDGFGVGYGAGEKFLGYIAAFEGDPHARTAMITGLPPVTEITVDVIAVYDGEVQPNSRWRTTATTTAAPPAPPPPPPPPPPPSGPYPRSGTWAEKKAFIVARAGTKAGTTFKMVRSGADLAVHRLPGVWANGTWTLGSGGPFEDLDVGGLIRYVGAEPLQILNSRLMGVAYTDQAGKRGGHFYRCTVVHNPNLALGQGAINFYGQTNWSVEQCDLSGFADGIQCSGPGLVADCYFHDFAYGKVPSGGPTHNDGIQNYGGPVVVERCVFEMGGRPESTNGAMFNSTPRASFTAREIWAQVDVPNANIVHAWQSTITIDGGYLKGGRIIGNVTLTNVERP